MRCIKTFCLLLLVFSKSNAQVGVSETDIRNYFKGRKFITSYLDGHKFMEYTEEDNFRTVYFINDKGICESIYMYPNNQKNLNDLNEKFNKECTLISKNKWRMYQGETKSDVVYIPQGYDVGFFIITENEGFPLTYCINKKSAEVFGELKEDFPCMKIGKILEPVYNNGYQDYLYSYQWEKTDSCTKNDFIFTWLYFRKTDDVCMMSYSKVDYSLLPTVLDVLNKSFISIGENRWVDDREPETTIMIEKEEKDGFLVNVFITPFNFSNLKK